MGEKAPEWTERAANFNELMAKESRRWRIIPNAWGGVMAIRDQKSIKEWDFAGSVDPTEVAFVRHEMKDEKTARDYISNVATEYALSRWKGL